MNKKTNSNEQAWPLLVLMLKEIADKKGITQDEIADKIGFHRQNVNRIFNLHYSPSLKNFIAIARAINVNFFFEDKESKTDLNQIFEAAMTELGRRAGKLPKN